MTKRVFRIYQDLVRNVDAYLTALSYDAVRLAEVFALPPAEAQQLFELLRRTP
jgi:hypothetical protein